MIHPLESHDSITIPLARADDLARVGGVAVLFADNLGCSIEVVSIIHPEDDVVVEFRRLGGAVERLAASIGKPVVLQLIAHENPLEAVLDACKHRLVCMATAATPFHNQHYVGSFAAALLSESSAPVILVGPMVTTEPTVVDNVVVAVSNEVDERAALLAGHELATAIEVPLAKVLIDPKGVIYHSDYHDLTDWLPDEIHASMATGPLGHDQICAELVDRSKSGILVLATRAHQGLAWICEGSVAFDTIARTSSPVVAFGPRAFEDERSDREINRSGDVILQSSDAAGAAVELEEHIRSTRTATSVTYTARKNMISKT